MLTSSGASSPTIFPERPLVFSLTLACVLGLVAAPAAAEEPRGIELAEPAQAAVLRLQDQWLVLSSAFLQGDEELAKATSRDLERAAAELGFSRLPELSFGMLARGVEAAREGDVARARWAVEIAEQLDPGSPEVGFARGRVESLAGRHLHAFFQELVGHARSLGSSEHRPVWLASLTVWVLSTLIVAAVAFIALELAAKGPHLLRDLASWAPWVPRPAGYLVALLVLGAPLVLPNGWLWVAMVWAALLWGYCSPSERWALVACLAAIGSAPGVASWQVERLAAGSSRELRAVDRFGEGRLYGEIFEDFRSLEARLPEVPAVDQLIADLELGMNQDDWARPRYHRVTEAEPQNGSALNNLGVFHFHRGEYVRAIEYFDRASRTEEAQLEAWYNLAASYRRLLEFANADRSLIAARELDAEAVARWIVDGDIVVSASGGSRRAGEIRRLLMARDGSPSLWRSILAFPALLVVLVPAVLMPRFGGRGRGSWRRSTPTTGSRLERWLRRWVPGLISAEAGDGGRALIAVSALCAVVMVPSAKVLGFRVPWGFDPGSQLVWVISGLGMVVLLGLRLARR